VCAHFEKVQFNCLGLIMTIHWKYHGNIMLNNKYFKNRWSYLTDVLSFYMPN